MLFFRNRHQGSRPEENKPCIEIHIEVQYIPFGNPSYLDISYKADGRAINSATVYIDGKQYRGDPVKSLIPVDSGEHEIEVVLKDNVGRTFNKKEKIKV